MHPLHFVEASAIKAVQMQDVKLASSACQSSLETFRESARLVLGLAATPSFSALISMQWAQAGTKAAIELHGETDYLNKLLNASPEQVERHFGLANKYMGQIVAASSPLLHANLADATRQLEQLVMNCGQYVHGIFEAVLKTIVVQSWGAFEAMTQTLWTKVIESNNASILRPNEKEWKKGLGFTSRNRIRRTFEFGFAVDNSDIRAALNQQLIDPLAVLRNVIVHHAGIVDETFKKDSAGLTLLAAQQALNLNSPIEFDGVLVRTVADPAISSGYALIRAVDAWLATHR